MVDIEEKPYKRNNALTTQQELFCQEVAKGQTQTEAYFIAYPKSKEWQRESVWVAASQLMSKEKIQRRVQELKEDTIEDVNWTRKKVLANINYILDNNKLSILRKKQIYQEMIDDKYNELMKWVSLRGVENIDKNGVELNINNITREIRELEIQKNSIRLNDKDLLSALQIINRMQGFDVTKVEVNTVDEERENMKALTVEELKAIAYSKMENKEGE